jgi:hypothetical protein
MSLWHKALQAGYIYTPNIPPIIAHVRSTIGNNQPVEPTQCEICSKPALKFEHEFVSIKSVMQGDFEGIPIDSSAVRAWFCWECFKASADSILIDNFEKYITFSGTHNEKCLYCNKVVITGYEELQKHFLITFNFKSGGKNSCVIDEHCYVKNINV